MTRTRIKRSQKGTRLLAKISSSGLGLTPPLHGTATRSPELVRAVTSLFPDDASIQKLAERQKVDEMFGAAQRKWFEAVPPAIKPLWERSLKSGRWAEVGQFREALVRGVPDRDER